MNYVWATGTHVGRIREDNEDAVYPAEDGAGPGPIVVAVADGMGGHVAGEVASRLAIEAATEAPADASVDPADRVQAANDAVVTASRNDPALAGMGTTLTLAVFDAEGTLHLGHVGDSRAYLYRHGELEQLTSDHTLVAEMAALGHIRPDEVDNHPQRNLITRVIGMEHVEADTRSLTLVGGDRVILCSDGLTGMVPQDQIIALLEASERPQDAVWALIEAANAHGGVDNTTVAVVDVRP